MNNKLENKLINLLSSIVVHGESSISITEKDQLYCEISKSLIRKGRRLINEIMKENNHGIRS